MDVHSEIKGALCARLAEISPACPVAWEGLPFDKPQLDAPDVAHVVSVTWPEDAPAAGTVFGVSVDGVGFAVSAQAGEGVARVLSRLAQLVFPAARSAGPVLTITGLSDATPLLVEDATPAASVAEVQPPAYGSVWLRPTVMPASPAQATLGADGFNRQRGVFQVSVFSPAGRGWSRAQRVAGSVCSLFKRGTRLAAGTFEVVCERAWPSAVIDDGAWVHVPVSVSYRADTPND